MSSPRPSRRSLLVGGASIAAVLLTGCSPDRLRPRPRDLRTRLAAALGAQDRARADLLADPHTDLTPVPAEWLPGWIIVDVLARIMPHPRRFYAALSDDDRGVVLTGRPDGFSDVLLDAGVRVDTAAVATAVTTVFLDATRDFRAWAYRIDSFADIEWLAEPTAAQRTRRDALAETYRDRIRAPRAEGGADGWLVSAWMVQGRDLVQHRLSVASGRPMEDAATTRERELPVPFSR